MTQQHRVALVVIVALILASFVQGIIMCAEVGLGNGWLLIRNDPGKFIFHLLLLPVSFGALVWSFPTPLLRQCLKDERNLVRYAVPLLSVALMVLGIGVGLEEAVDGFEERIPVPTDVKAVVTRDGLDHTARADLLVAWLELHDPAWMPDSPSAESKPPYSRERSDAYDSVLKTALGPTRDFWTQASVGGWWSALLSVLGILLGGAW